LANNADWPPMQALNELFPLGLPYDDLLKLAELSNGFKNPSGGILDGFVMAIDGFGVLTRAPYQCEVERPKDYRCRKTGFAIIVLARCDINGRILFRIIWTPQNVNIRIFIVTYVVVSYEETEVVASQFFSSTKPYDTVGVYFCFLLYGDG